MLKKAPVKKLKGYKRQLPVAKWKKAGHVKSLTFSTNSIGKPIKIGGHVVGDVYIGRLVFKGERTRQKDRPKGLVGHRVAIKRRKHNMGKITDEKAAKLNQGIRDLHKAGIWLPKMWMVKLKKGTKIGNERLEVDEWVQVSQLFGSIKQGSKIVNKNQWNIKTQSGRTEAVRNLTRAINAGYHPNYDLIEPFKKESLGVLPIDLDDVVKESKWSLQRRAEKLSENITVKIGRRYPDEIKRLFNVAIRTASPKLKNAIKNTPQYKKI